MKDNKDEVRKIKVIQTLITWQGEASNAGKRVLLLRFKYCNLNCPWCDTSILMRNTVESYVTSSEVQEIINGKKLGLMITGGEPTHPKHFDDVKYLLSNISYPFACVESNGYQLIKLMNDVSDDKINLVNYVWSPKISNEMTLDRELQRLDSLLMVPSVLSRLTIKVVYSKELNQKSNNCINHFLKRINELNLNTISYLMPVGITYKELLTNSVDCFDIAEKYMLNFSSRQHIIYSFL